MKKLEYINCSDIDDDKRLWDKFRTKRKNGKLVGFLLSFQEYCSLLREADIQSSQIHISGHHLARFGDIGPYRIGNCRFIPYRENLREQKQENTLAKSKRQKKYYKNRPGTWTGKFHKEESKLQIGLKNKIYTGEKNSQYGTCWINKDGIEKKIKKEGKDKFVEEGWILGRIKKLFGNRLVVGQRDLAPLTGVRITLPDPIKD